VKWMKYQKVEKTRWIILQVKSELQEFAKATE